jgi:hypothetical protein
VKGLRMGIGVVAGSHDSRSFEPWLSSMAQQRNAITLADGYTIVHAVSCHLTAVLVQVQSKNRSCQIRGRLSGTGPGFL